MQGNLTLITRDLPDEQNLKFGFLFTDDQRAGHYDGLHVETNFVKSELPDESHQMAFTGYDVWTDTRPDTIMRGASVLELPIDRLNNYTINKMKSHKRCGMDGVCEINAHFWRFFETADPKDFQLSETFDKEFHIMGYYESYDMNSGMQTRRAQGMSDDFRTTIGLVRDYELSGAHTQLASAAFAAGAALLLAVF